MFNSFERAIISRLHPWCGEPPCEKYLDSKDLKVIEYPEHLEIFCLKHGNGIPGDKIGSNCLLRIFRSPGPLQPTLQDALRREKMRSSL